MSAPSASWRWSAWLPGAVSPIAATCASREDRKSTRLNSSHSQISYAVFCLKKKNQTHYLRCHRVRLFARLHTIYSWLHHPVNNHFLQYYPRSPTTLLQRLETNHLLTVLTNL